LSYHFDNKNDEKLSVLLVSSSEQKFTYFQNRMQTQDRMLSSIISLSQGPIFTNIPFTMPPRHIWGHLLRWSAFFNFSKSMLKITTSSA